MTNHNSKVVSRLQTVINDSRTSRFKDKFAAISSLNNKQWEVKTSTGMTPVEEYDAWQAYGKDLARLKEPAKAKAKEEKALRI